MTTKELEKRVTLLEAELAEVKKQLPAKPKPRLVDAAWDVFAGDPIFLEAMELGRQYRDSLPRVNGKTKTKSSRRRGDARARH